MKMSGRKTPSATKLEKFSSKLSAKGDSGDNVKLIWIISSGYQSHDLKEISLVAQQIMFTVVTYICLVSSSLDNFQSFSWNWQLGKID